MALLFTVTAVQRYKKQGESFFIRLVLGGWFSLTTIFHELPVDLVRNGSAILIVIMLALESTAPYARRYWERK
jgi:RsiW-degrading membrane proteinase PrsW (M82 family)